MYNIHKGQSGYRAALSDKNKLLKRNTFVCISSLCIVMSVCCMTVLSDFNCVIAVPKIYVIYVLE